MIRKRFQNKIATGNLTFPVVTIVSALLWILIYFVKPETQIGGNGYYFTHLVNSLQLNEFVERILNFLLYSIVVYILIGLNNAFTLIRTRTTIHACFYLLFITICPVLQAFQPGAFIAICVCLSLFYLFRTYQKSQPVGHIFHSCLFMGLGSLLFPQFLYLFPIWIIGAYNFQSLSPRTFFAGLMGLSVPYWFLLAYSFYYNKMDLFYAPFNELVSFASISFKSIPLWGLTTIGGIFLISLISIFHYSLNSYQDKIRTRSYLNFLVLLEMILLMFLLLQPQHAKIIFPILLICISILTGHFFTLSNSKASNITFITSIILLIALLYCNLWMPSYSF